MMKIFSHAGFRTLGAALAVSGGLVLAAVPAVGVQAADAAQATQAGDVAPAGQPIWIDVRTPKEFDGGHLEGAHNVPVEQIAGQISTLVPNKDTPVMLYCRSGRRAEQARKLLLQQGYTHVENKGGYAAHRPVPGDEELGWAIALSRLARLADPLRRAHPSWRERISADLTAIERIARSPEKEAGWA